jgi:ribonuclease P protein component
VFRKAFAQRRAVSDATLVVHALRNGLTCTRLGISVSRRVTRRAVVRNRLKRLIREAFRLHKTELPTGFDLIVVPRSCDLQAAAVAASLVRLARDAARRADAASPPAATGEPPP